LNSSISIAAIAAHFGYSRRVKFDQSYSRLFGITPAEDRRRTKLTKL
jgi:transcriptional regulator GlxA family with amidase domain